VIEQLDTRYGTLFVPDTDIGQYGWLKLAGASPEDEYIALVCDLLDDTPKGLVIDVGANLGCWSLPLAAHATRVVAFEPQHSIFQLLRQSIKANPQLNISPFNLAVGEEKGSITVPRLTLDTPTNFGGITLGMPHHEQPDAPMDTVAVVTLDEFVYASDPVKFIKVDVEGAELSVLKGAQKLIKKYKPFLFIESDHKYTDTAALAAFIESLNYGISDRGPNFLAVPL
jgi:FkbM family methyltransferase